MKMYKLRMVTHALVSIFVLVVALAQLGYVQNPSLVFTSVALASTIWLAANRTTWLPFLGPTAMPTGILRVQKPSRANFRMTLTAPPDAVRCVFWGSVVSASDPWTAYGSYENAGVADVVNGQAVVELVKPVAYKVNGRTLAPHVHYRWVGTRGLLSGVRTAAC